MAARLFKRSADASVDTHQSRPDANYRIWRLPNAGTVGAYYVESTAPNNIEDPYESPTLKQIPQVDGTPHPHQLLDKTAAAELAAYLDTLATPVAAGIAPATGKEVNPQIIFLVNGFNTPRAGSAALVERAHAAMCEDERIQQHPGLVFVGYRWPSEALGSPWHNSKKAASWAFRLCLYSFFAILVIGIGDFFDLRPNWGWLPDGAFLWAVIEFALIALAAASFLVLSRWIPLPDWLVGAITASAWILLCGGVGAIVWTRQPGWAPPILSSFWLVALLIAFTIPVGLFILRVFVYFRDVYRATNYGVPDLLQLIRDLDGKLAKTPLGQRIAAKTAPPVKISFVCHSLGALVVTNLVRILSDVFTVQDADGRPVDAADQPNSQRVGQQITRLDTGIGSSFALGRLVLLSPDIPAAALLTNRANFLHAALRRFEEAHLFSSEGDEVLRTASTLANYFVFPNAHQQHGYRLGNAEVRPAGKLGYGIVNLQGPWADGRFLQSIRIGEQSLFNLHEAVNGAGAPIRECDEQGRSPTPFPLQVTYFDCTDYRDTAEGDGLLTRALGKAQLTSWDHTGLLVQYVANWYRQIDVHGGYFHGKFSQELIYRLACLGYTGLLGTDVEREAELNKLCGEKQIRVLLSPDRQSGQAVPTPTACVPTSVAGATTPTA